uniref:Uncharacterized protein n=1 Tax=Sphaerodactylus townsendi TaxID=933632 RepID=A0ACB8ED12_9SAUR
MFNGIYKANICKAGEEERGSFLPKRRCSRRPQLGLPNFCPPGRSSGRRRRFGVGEADRERMAALLCTRLLLCLAALLHSRPTGLFACASDPANSAQDEAVMEENVQPEADSSPDEPLGITPALAHLALGAANQTEKAILEALHLVEMPCLHQAS